jgi:hypothetical protein
MSNPKFAATAILLLASSFAVAGNATNAKMTGIFSNLAYSAQGGDMVGVEVFITSDGGAYYAIVQCGAGRLGAPILVPVNIDVPQVSFILPKQNEANCPDGEVKGTITTRGLRAKIDDRDWPVYLPRRKSYWQ